MVSIKIMPEFKIERSSGFFDSHDEHSRTVNAIGRKAANLFASGQMWCAEAVFYVLNRSFDGGLPPETAQQLGSGLGQGVGGKGCICGALNGAAMAIGLLLGNHKPGWSTNKHVMELCGQLHDRFRKAFGATCCRTLTRSVEEGSRQHIHRCAMHTAMAAATAAEIILEQKPQLEEKVDFPFLERLDGRLSSGLKILSGLLQP